jgi:hypothetical protein
MSLSEELSILFNLHKSGGLSDSEFQTLKTRMIRENPNEVARVLKSQKSGSNLSPLQVGAIAGATAVGSRIIMDHLKGDKVLRDQVEKLELQVGDLEERVTLDEIQDADVNYQESDFDGGYDFG